MATEKRYHHWHVEKDKDQIVWAWFDKENSSVNTINPAVLSELSSILTDVSNQENVRGLILASKKASGFIAGADVEQFTKFKTSDEVAALINHGQSVANQLEAMKIPTVAMINGFCLGGGTELSLACRYRVAEDGPKTKIGLPEILLGIHPGWGGTVRMQRLIGAPQAMDLILSGRAVSGKAAEKMGLVDVAVPERHLVRAAVSYILEKPAVHQATALQTLTNQTFVRPILAKFLREKVAQKASPKHYPAPYAVIDNWVKYGVEPADRALRAEADSLAHIAMGDTARNLIRVFMLQERLKGLSKGVPFKASHVHVVGAGTMGGDIAAWCALRGLTVTLQDREPKFIAPAIKRANDLFQKKLKLPRLVDQAMDRLQPDVQGLGISRADVIIEAIFENLEAKQKLFKEVELIAKPTAILATNTSSIPLDEINSVMQKPQRLVGIHFFNPVALMQLVEVVRSNVATDEVINDAIAFVRQIDRLPLPVKSYPGFLVNRILMAYLMEAMTILGEGVPAPAIDKAALDFGMPMGPIELADVVGLDVCLAVAKNLSAHLGGTVPQKLVDMVNAGKLGRKSGSGFYTYKNGKPVKEKITDDQINYTELADRMILRFVNESMTCLREKIIADSDLLDAGMIFGTGFAPFRGGPMHYAYTLGVDVVVAKLNEFAQKFGERFKPDAGWNTVKAKSVKEEA